MLRLPARCLPGRSSGFDSLPLSGGLTGSLHLHSIGQFLSSQPGRYLGRAGLFPGPHRVRGQSRRGNHLLRHGGVLFRRSHCRTGCPDVPRGGECRPALCLPGRGLRCRRLGCFLSALTPAGDPPLIIPGRFLPGRGSGLDSLPLSGGLTGSLYLHSIGQFFSSGPGHCPGCAGLFPGPHCIGGQPRCGNHLLRRRSGGLHSGGSEDIGGPLHSFSGGLLQSAVRLPGGMLLLRRLLQKPDFLRRAHALQPPGLEHRAVLFPSPAERRQDGLPLPQALEPPGERPGLLSQISRQGLPGSLHISAFDCRMPDAIQKTVILTNELIKILIQIPGVGGPFPALSGLFLPLGGRAALPDREHPFHNALHSPALLALPLLPAQGLQHQAEIHLVHRGRCRLSIRRRLLQQLQGHVGPAPLRPLRPGQQLLCEGLGQGAEGRQRQPMPGQHAHIRFCHRNGFHQ